MEKISKRLLSILLAMMLVFGLFTAIPLTASAEDGPFRVTEDPADATYYVGDVAFPLEAEFLYNVTISNKEVNRYAPINIQWYWDTVNSNESRANLVGPKIDVPYVARIMTAKATHTPSTAAAGVRFYYAVITYTENVYSGELYSPEERETVTNPARIEVVEPGVTTDYGFRVRKTDENGDLLSGAIIALTPDSAHEQPSSVQSYEQTTSGGYASFSAGEGYYILSEKQAPAGYNASNEKYYISITTDGVFIYTPGTNHFEMYELVTFVNKPIPQLNKDDHFAFMQGYPDGTFGPNRNMTRAEAVVMFSRLLAEGMNMTVNHRNNAYPDVAASAWYSNQVGYMYTLGVLADYSRDNRFRPNDPVTRAEFATLAAHFDNLTLTSTNKFSDVSSSHWAVKYINSAAAKGWITGYPNGTFMPESNIARAEVVTLVGRMLDRTADSAFLAANASSLPRSYSDITPSYWGYLAIMEASLGHDYVMEDDKERWTKVYQ